MALTREQRRIKELESQLQEKDELTAQLGMKIHHMQADLAVKTPAAGILKVAGHMLNKNAKARDSEQTGERSMSRCVHAFNALTGKDLTETEGWQFMQLLKLARATTAGALHNEDDFVDGAAYAALAGEASRVEKQPELTTVASAGQCIMRTDNAAAGKKLTGIV